jgi:hypothetical protein
LTKGSVNQLMVDIFIHLNKSNKIILAKHDQKPGKYQIVKLIRHKNSTEKGHFKTVCLSHQVKEKRNSPMTKRSHTDVRACLAPRLAGTGALESGVRFGSFISPDRLVEREDLCFDEDGFRGELGTDLERDSRCSENMMFPGDLGDTGDEGLVLDECGILGIRKSKDEANPVFIGPGGFVVPTRGN